MTYSEKLKDPRWQKKRLEVMERDGFKCRDCESTRKMLHVHHCGYRGKNPWEAPLGLLLTLCVDCHENRQALERETRDKLEEWFSRSPISDIVSACITTDFEFDWNSSIRWFIHANDNPDFRKHFEAVTGTSPKWKVVDGPSGD